ncbi:MAG TPA: TrbI/VirB10 family protein [Stellaceae bacterium]|nr:TrbI/VirB10 family protein [Stellaceae bacterium]
MRRLNKVPLAIFFGGGVVVAGAFGYGLHLRSEQQATGQREAVEHKPAPANAAAILDGAPSGAIAPAVFHPAPLAQPLRPPSAAPNPAGAAIRMPSADTGAEAYRKEAWKAYWAALAELQKAKFDKAKAALAAKTGVSIDSGSGTPAAPPPAPAPVPSPVPGVPPAAGYAPAFAGGFSGFGLAGVAPVGIDVPGQREKQAYLAQPGDTGTSDVLPFTRRPAPSPFTVSAGTFIPAALITGSNSDLPGPLLAMVSQDVFDTAGHSRCPLIPQGAKLIGTYDNAVSAGQDRLLFVFNRIIYPDASSVDLGTMSGLDQSGYAGARDQLDRHFWEKFGNAVLLAIAGSAAQLSQPAAPVGGTYSAQQVASAQLGQQFAELGQEYAQAGLAIPNTIRVRPGYRFNVFVNKDMVLPPWHCGGFTPPQLPIMSASD